MSNTCRPPFGEEGEKHWWVSGCFCTRTMYAQHPLTTYLLERREGGETLVGQRVFLYKDDVQHPLTAF